jgi:hypothetical protein
MKAASAVLVILALAIAIVPAFTDCLSQGRSLKLANGTTVPMKCHWTAMAAIATAIPLGIAGIVSGFSKRRETRRALMSSTAVLGAMVILLPTVFIGVCANNEMLCNMIMKPTLILSGSLAILISLAVIVFTQLHNDEIVHDTLATSA